MTYENVNAIRSGSLKVIPGSLKVISQACLMISSISVHQWQADTRPCDFSLYLETVRSRAIFADFDSDADGCVSFRRVSFDGFGCYPASGECTKLDASDSIELMDWVRKHDVDNDIVRRILIRYFNDNKDFAWREALEDHGLLNE